MFTFPICHFLKAKIPATVEFIRIKTNPVNQTSISDVSVPIGDAYDERWVVFCVHAGSNGNLIGTLSATIGGVAATRLLVRHEGDQPGGAAMFIRKVSAGTTVTCTATISSGNMQYSGASTYVLRDISSGTPESSFINTGETVTRSGNLTVTKDAVSIGDAAGWTNVASTWAWSGTLGVVEQWDQVISGTNDLRGSGAIGTSLSAGSKSVIATSSVAMLSNAPADLLAASWS